MGLIWGCAGDCQWCGGMWARQVVAMLQKEIVTCGAAGGKWHALPPHKMAFEVMASKHLITPNHNKHRLTGEAWAELFSLNTRNKGSRGADDESQDPIAEDNEYAHDDVGEHIHLLEKPVKCMRQLGFNDGLADHQ